MHIAGVYTARIQLVNGHTRSGALFPPHSDTMPITRRSVPERPLRANTCTAPQFPAAHTRAHACDDDYRIVTRRDKRRVVYPRARRQWTDGRMDERTNEQMPGGQGGAPSTCPNKARRSSEGADFSRDFSRASSKSARSIQESTDNPRRTIAREFLNNFRTSRASDTS